MKNLNFTLFVASVSTITAILCGCVSAPGTYPTVSGSDDVRLTQETTDAVERAKTEQKFKIAVVPERAEYTNAFAQKYEINKLVGDQVEALCGGLSMFEIIARQELDIISAEEAVKNLNSPNAAITLPKPVDALLVYSIPACSIDAKEFIESEYQGKRRVQRKVMKYSGFVTLKITLINTKNQSKLFTKTVSGRSQWEAGGETSQLLVDAVASALAEFIKEFAYDFAPCGYVIQTTGNGLWAKISLGTGSGLKLHTKVEFITKDVNGQWRPYAYGEVREPNYDYSWVLVKDFENSQVRNNARVKVAADQNRSLDEVFADIFSLVYGK